MATVNPMEESILDSVKLCLGVSTEYEVFDQQIMLHLNSIFSVLYQLGVGPSSGFFIQNNRTTWGDLLEDLPDPNLFLYVKSYVCLRVRLLFDPPASSGAIDAIERQVRELEWRITVTIDPERRSDE